VTLLSVLSFLAVMLVLACLPSASVALVVARSAGHGVANGVAAAVGVVLGDLLFVALALLGMELLAHSLGAFFAVLKYAGGAYLIWLGITLLRSRGDVPHSRSGGGGTSLLSSVAAGLLLTLGDVKAVLFYASLFPNLFDLAALTSGEILLILVLTAVTVGGVKIGYAVAAPRVAERLQCSGLGRCGQRLAGGALVGTGCLVMMKG